MPGDNLKFAAEALREALEETGLTIEDIVHSMELDVKYNRFDWDARAAQGVDVGGVVVVVNNDWTPAAGDDALKTEWVTLQDVADGKVELAFGHAEFVQEGFEKFYDTNRFEQTNPKKTFYGIYVNNNNPESILQKLDDISKQNSQRNINIINESNPVRVAAGQPEIDITNKTVFDRQNNKLLDSIYRMDQVPFRGSRVISSELLRPEIILNHILEPITNSRNGESVWDVDYNINENSFKDPKDGKSLTYSDPNFEHNQTWQFKEFTDQKQLNIKRQVQRQIVERYRSFLGSLQTNGMAINHIQIQMLEHIIDIVNSKDFDNLFNALMEDGLKINTGFEGNATIRGLGDGSEIRGQIKNHVDGPDGDDIDIVFNNNVEQLNSRSLKEPMINIINTHTEFVNNTLPEGALVKPADAAKDMNLGNSALLESMGATRNGDVIKGMTYHGGNGLSNDGKEIFKEIQKIFPEIMNTEVNLEKTNQTRNTSFNDTLDNFINRVTEQNNLEWLDPRIDRQVNSYNLLRGNVFYTTSNPFLAASYSIGGLNVNDGLDYLFNQSNKFYNTLELVINTPEFLGLTPDDDGVYRFDEIPERINKLDNVLKKYGLTISDSRTSPLPTTKTSGILQNNYDSVFKIQSLGKKPNTERPLLIDPFITQVVYEAPVDSFLFTDGELGPQMNSNIETALNSVITNSSADVWLTDQQIQNTAEKLLLQVENRSLTSGRVLNRSQFYNQYYEDIGTLLKDMVDNPSKYRETFASIVNLYSPRIEKAVSRRVSQILKNGTSKWNDIPKFLEGNIFQNGNIFGEEIYPTIKQEHHASTINGFFVDQSRTLPNAGELVLADKINEYLIEKHGVGESSMNVKELDNFIKTLNVEIFGSDVIARRDYETIKLIMETIDNDPAWQNAYDVINQQNITNPNTGESAETVVRQTITGRELRYGKGVTSTDLLDKRSGGLINFIQDVISRNMSDMQVPGANELLNQVYELRNTILDEGLKSLNLSKEEKFLFKYLIDISAEEPFGSTTDVLRNFVNSQSAADYISLKSLSDGGIESTFGSGGASHQTAFHDTHYIVDPGNKFNSNVPKLQTYNIKTVTPKPETLVLMHKLANGHLSLENLNLNQIEEIGEVVPIEHILNNQNIPMEQKIKWQALYTTGGISDQRYASIENITPSSIDAPYLLQNEEIKNAFNEKLINNANNVDEVLELTQKQTKNLIDNFGDEAVEVAIRTGFVSTLANGLDLWDGVIAVPVIIDLLGSRISGPGQYTETMGGAVGDVAQKIYDPETKDTFFEEVWGSPADFSDRYGPETPESMAAAASSILTSGKDLVKSQASTIGNLFGVNETFTNMWEDMKEGVASTFGTIADAHGLNDWIYNFKKDMYVTTVAKESGINPQSNKYAGLVNKLGDQYETMFPKTEDRFGNSLDNQGDS